MHTHFSLVGPRRALALCTLLVIASLGTACGDGDTPPANDASIGRDLGRADGGGSETDAAVDTDGGDVDGGGSDGGGSDVDGGGSDVDGGGSDVDGGGSDVDGGGSDVDGGMSGTDAGTVDLDAGPAPMCAMRARPSCCFDDGDCPSRGSRCVGAVCRAASEGVCKGPVEPGRCWSNDDCGGGRCVESNICPCGARCLVPDSPGTCAPRA